MDSRTRPDDLIRQDAFNEVPRNDKLFAVNHEESQPGLIVFDRVNSPSNAIAIGSCDMAVPLDVLIFVECLKVGEAGLQD